MACFKNQTLLVLAAPFGLESTRFGAESAHVGASVGFVRCRNPVNRVVPESAGLDLELVVLEP